MTTLPFCTPSCRDRQGQIEDPETGLPIGRCECRTAPQTETRETAIRTVELAKLSQNQAARAIIRDIAEAMPVFSANDTNTLMRDAQIDVKGVAGAAFGYASGQGWIEWTGTLVPSHDPDIRHPVKLWKSNRYKGTAA